MIERLKRASSIPKNKAFEETLRDRSTSDNRSKSRLNDKS